jgi:hypothetical protein
VCSVSSSTALWCAGTRTGCLWILDVERSESRLSAASLAIIKEVASVHQRGLLGVFNLAGIGRNLGATMSRHLGTADLPSKGPAGGRCRGGEQRPPGLLQRPSASPWLGGGANRTARPDGYAWR